MNGVKCGAFALVLAAALGSLPMPATAQSTGELDLEWYGYVKLDASWDEALANVGNFARWVISPESEHPHPSFSMTSRQTRLGFRVGTETGSAKLNARWEADFYAGAAENKNGLQVRHAYVDIVWPSGWEVLAGQTSDVISPLNPTTLNYTVAWWAGNIGYRRPQLRVTRNVQVGGATLVLRGAAARTIGDDFAAADPGDSGSAAGYPTLQGLAGIGIPLGGKTLSLGVYSHRGDENLRHELCDDSCDGTDHSHEVASSSFGGYLSVPLGPLTFSGEGWVGSNMDDYFGGIGQGVVMDAGPATAVGGKGGWVQLSLHRNDTRMHSGFGVDDPDDVDLLAGQRARNFVHWCNIIRDFGGGLQVGLEYSLWKTRYMNLLEGTSSRVQGSVIYAF